MNQYVSAGGPDIPGYRDLRLIAHGSTALVFSAVQDRLERQVAIKILSVDEVMTTWASVAKELETTVAVSAHPHIVSIIDTGTTHEGQPYIVMEYCEGGSYSQIVKANGPLPVSDVIDVGVKIGEALHAAHSVGILHRDVKPQNILRTKFGPALADFGIARAADELASTGTIDKLTPLHSAPETLRREHQSPASDVYSLASTMWHLLVGRGPFSSPNGRTDPDEFRQRVEHALAPSVPRPDVPSWLQHELARALAKDPSARHPSAYAFAEDLRRHSYGVIGGPSSEGPGTFGVMTPDPSEELTTFNFPPSGVSAAGVNSLAPAPPSMPPAPPPPPPVATDPFASGGHYAPAPPVSAAPAHTSAPPFPHGPVVYTPPPSAEPDTMPLRAPAPRAPAERGSRLGLYLGGTAALLVLAVLIVIVGFALRNSGGTGDDAQDQPVDGTASVTTNGPATGVRIDSDSGGEVTLSWTDPTDGAVPFAVFGARQGEEPVVMQSLEAGGTEVTISGLNPDADYCFVVAAVYSVDEIARSEEVCTARTDEQSQPFGD